MSDAKGLVYKTYGKADEVISYDSVPEDSSLGPKSVRIRLLAAAIHPSDFGMIGGVYGKLKELPAIGGREGVGEIVEMGSDVQTYRVGDRVRFPESKGVWRTSVVVEDDLLTVIPDGVSNEMAAMAFVNPPTAWRLLRDSHLEEGDWVIQNAANSAVGICVIQMAKSMGLKTLNVVRNSSYVEPLKKMGADQVVLEDSGFEKNIAELTQKGRVKVALNSVGGESAIRQIKSLSEGGMQVTFGGMSFEPIRFPTRYLIFNNISLRGFWMDKWYRERSDARVSIMMDKIYDLMIKGEVAIPVEKTYRLSDYKEAFAHAGKSRFGKILFVND